MLLLLVLFFRRLDEAINIETVRSVTIVYVLVVPFYATHPLVDVIMLITSSCYIQTHKVHLMDESLLCVFLRLGWENPRGREASGGFVTGFMEDIGKYPSSFVLKKSLKSWIETLIRKAAFLLGKIVNFCGISMKTLDKNGSSVNKLNFDRTETLIRINLNFCDKHFEQIH